MRGLRSTLAGLALGALVLGAARGCGPRRFPCSFERGTRVRLARVGAEVERFWTRHGYAPLELEELLLPDERGETGLRCVPLDPWKRAVRYVPPTGERPPTVLSWGRDGAPGGSGLDADVVWTPERWPPSAAGVGEEGADAR